MHYCGCRARRVPRPAGARAGPSTPPATGVARWGLIASAALPLWLCMAPALQAQALYEAALMVFEMTGQYALLAIVLPACVVVASTQAMALRRSRRRQFGAWTSPDC